MAKMKNEEADEGMGSLVRLPFKCKRCGVEAHNLVQSKLIDKGYKDNELCWYCDWVKKGIIPNGMPSWSRK